MHRMKSNSMDYDNVLELFTNAGEVNGKRST